MRKPQDMKILRTLSNGPKNWRELKEIGLSSGGLSYNLNKLKNKKLIEQLKPGGNYYLTLDGQTELREREIIEDLEKRGILQDIKEGTEGDRGFFADSHLREKNSRSGAPIVYFFYPSGDFRGMLPKSPMSSNDKKRLFSAIEALIAVISGEPATHFNPYTGIFLVKLEKHQQKSLDELTIQRGMTNISGAFSMCFEKGLSQMTAGEYSDFSLSLNLKHWPLIYERERRNLSSNDVKAPLIEALDHFEEKLRNGS